TVLDLVRSGKPFTLEDMVKESSAGVLCVEAGGPVPGLGCAGRGIITAFDKLEELDAFETYKPDVVLYDVLGDVVCGGFAMPIRNGYADKVFIVTSGEMMALYAASNIVHAIKNFGSRGYAQYAGVILNSRNVKDEQETVQKALDEIGGKIIKVVPRDASVQIAENQGKTVMEALPQSEMAGVYMDLARKVLAECDIELPSEQQESA
ncbi:MAG: nitrogenase iron protein, partial [Spirochaetaceae bacterium]|nr:nitrogenase iron protein [Spirochaetaceae bacterium]